MSSKACRMLNLDEDGSSTPNTAIIKLGENIYDEYLKTL